MSQIAELEALLTDLENLGQTPTSSRRPTLRKLDSERPPSPPPPEPSIPAPSTTTPSSVTSPRQSPAPNSYNTIKAQPSPVVSSSGAPVLTLDQKLDELRREKQRLSQLLTDITVKKHQAAANEDYDAAYEFKVQSEQIDKQLATIDQQIAIVSQQVTVQQQEREKQQQMLIQQQQQQLLKQQVQQTIRPASNTTAQPASTQPGIDMELVKKSPEYAKLEQVFLAKKDDLNKQKSNAIQQEDYENAQYFKAQIEQLEKNFQNDVQQLASKLKPAQPVESRPRTATVDKGGTIRKKQYPQDSKLYDISRSGRLQDVKKAIEEDKLDINSIDFNTGNTALHAAVIIGNRPIIKYLIDKQAEINIKNRRGQTPLHLSVEKRLDDMTEYLMKNGGDVKVEDNTGKTPYDLAGVAPAYQAELKELIVKLTRESNPPDVENNNGEALGSSNNNTVSLVSSGNNSAEDDGRVEAVAFYLKNGSFFTFQIRGNDVASRACVLCAEKMRIKDLAESLEVSEDLLGKERKLKPTEILLDSKDKWPNQNPTYCKFKIGIKPGTSSDGQMRFRQAMYGK